MNFLGGYITLLKTILGSGILFIPKLFKTFGLFHTLILMFLSAFLTGFGLQLYAECNDVLKDRSANISTFAEITTPKWASLVDFTVFFKCFGISTSYLIIIREILPDVLYNIFKIELFKDKRISLAVFLCFIGPITYFRTFNNLKYTSLFGIIAVFSVILLALLNIKYEKITPKPITIYKPLNMSIVPAIGSFIFAFTCHQNFVTVQNEITYNSMKNIQRLIFLLIFTVILIYLTFGSFNYIYFGENIRDNILTTYPQNKITDLIKLCYILIMGFSYPLQIIPCRIYFYNLMSFSSKENLENNFLHFIVTTSIIGVTFFLTVMGLNLSDVYSFIGNTASAIICLVFPAIFYLKLNLSGCYLKILLIYILLGSGLIIFSKSIYDLLNI